MKTFAVLITCFNRVETTLECLRHLYVAKLPVDVSFDVWLNDDGCTDGTGERVANEFPSVKMIKGSGRDYWCGGMRRVWYAAAKHFDYDGYLWLNDDTILASDAFLQIFDCPYRWDAILVGATLATEGGRTTYSGRDVNGCKIDPTGRYEEVFNINGNFVWIPRAVFGVLGNFPCYFTHAAGDFDYGLRAKEHCIKISQSLV